MQFRKTLAAAIVAAACCAATLSADAPVAAEKSVAAPHAQTVAVKMIGPVTQTTDLQVLCILRHDPRGDRYIEAMADFNAKVGGLLGALRDRGEFVGEPGETLLFTPPAGSIAPRRVLLIGVGPEADLAPATLELAGRIAAREAVRLKAADVSWAPALRDQGSTRIDVGEGDAAFARGWVAAYDTEKRLQAQHLATPFDVTRLTIEAGPKYFDGAFERVAAAVAAAADEIAKRDPTPYVGAK